MRYDFFQPGDGWLHRLDARVKLLGVAFVFAAAFLCATPGGAALLLLAVVAVFAGGRLDPRPFRTSFWFMLYLALVSTVLWALLRPGDGDLLEAGPLRVSLGSLGYGALVGLRIVCMMLSPLVLLACTRQDDLVQAMHRLGLPHKAAFTVGMAFRMLPTTAGTTLTIKDAQRARGLELDRGNPLTRMRKNLALLVPLTLLSFDMVDRMSLAIDSRGLGAVPRRTYLRTMRWRRADLAAVLLLAGLLMLLVLARAGVLPWRV